LKLETNLTCVGLNSNHVGVNVLNKHPFMSFCTMN